ncbi:hypothetical protein [Amycolatopsis circi]|uniref:hypothetical protein n=1 Tax=Amycolatopsis circi TaxID=871959 RepID=UPI000E27A7F3|nr:hypothetical protein [Amycolatopsis circi]
MYPLAEGEQLLWSGRPRRYVRRYADYHNYVAAAVTFGAIAALGIGGIAIFEVDSDIFALWPGFFGAAIALIAEQNRQRRVLFGVLTYLVTDRRIVFVADRPGGIEFRWVWFPDLEEPQVRDHGDGTGTVGFAAPMRVRLRAQKFQARSLLTSMVPELVAIEDPEHVAELIARNAPRTPAAG